MADEQNKDWKKEMDEQEKKWAEQEAEYERSLRSLRRWKVVANCVEMVGITFVTMAVGFGAFELGRRLELRAEKQRQKTCVVESAKADRTSDSRLVPDDIYKGYAMATGAEVSVIAGYGGLTPPHLGPSWGHFGAGTAWRAFYPDRAQKRLRAECAECAEFGGEMVSETGS